MAQDEPLSIARAIAFRASVALLFLFLQAVPGPSNDEAEITKKIVASGGKIYRIRAGTPDKDGWYEAESTHRHFKVRLPAQFNDFMLKDTGDVIEATGVGTSTPDHTKWLATLVSYKDAGVAKRYFNTSWNDAPRGATIQSFDFHGQPAKEVWIHGRTRSFTQRTVWLGSENYSLMVEYDAGLDLKKDILKFLNSLEFPPPGSKQ